MMNSWLNNIPKNYVSQIIYDSGSGNTTADNKVVFNDYDTMITYINNNLQGAQVAIKLIQNETLPARTSQNWDGITWKGDGKPASLGGPILTIPDGFTVSSWSNAFIDQGLHLKSVSTTPIMTISSGTFLFAMLFANLISSTQAEFFRFTGSANYNIIGVTGGSQVQDDGYEVFNLQSNFPIFVTSTSGANAAINAETIRGTVGLWLNQFGDMQSNRATLTNTHSNFSGTRTDSNLLKAANADWAAQSLATDTTTGLKIGTATSQKIGLFNATPVVQPNGTGETTGFTAGSGTGVNDDSTFTGNVGSTAYRVNDVVKALKNLGILAQ